MVITAHLPRAAVSPNLTVECTDAGCNDVECTDVVCTDVVYLPAKPTVGCTYVGLQRSGALCLQADG